MPSKRHNQCKFDSKQRAKVLIPALRMAAKRHGYALGVHGSLAYDIDLIACPWTEHAVSAEELKNAMIKVCEAVNGFAHISPLDKAPETKPHGRLGWSIHLGGGPYLDLSIMPRLASEVKDESKT